MNSSFCPFSKNCRICVPLILTVDFLLTPTVSTRFLLNKLGTVKDFYKIDAGNVYYNKWRVNVWTIIWKDGMYGPSYNIKYSYFCTIQDNCIANSNPEIIPEKLQLRV